MLAEFFLNRSRENLPGGQEAPASEVVVIGCDVESERPRRSPKRLERLFGDFGPNSVSADDGQSICHGKGVYEPGTTPPIVAIMTPGLTARLRRSVARSSPVASSGRTRASNYGSKNDYQIPTTARSQGDGDRAFGRPVQRMLPLTVGPLASSTGTSGRVLSTRSGRHSPRSTGAR